MVDFFKKEDNMAILERLTKEQQKQVDAEQKRYDAAKAAAEKSGKKFDPLDDAPTPGPDFKNDPVQRRIQQIWFGNKTK